MVGEKSMGGERGIDYPDWLKERRDRKGRKEGSEGFEEWSVFIPQEAFNKFTETFKQYWEIKRNNWDKIVMMQIGSFYELYFNDAEIGNKLFGLKISSRNCAGFPLKEVDLMIKKFVLQGYKVIRIEQAVTLPKSTTSSSDKKPKNVERKVTEFLTAGTLVTYSQFYFFIISKLLPTNSPFRFLKSDRYLESVFSNYLMSVFECQVEEGRGGEVRVGLVLTDVTVGEVYVGWVEDDSQRSNLNTLLMQMRPKEVIFLPHNLSPPSFHSLSNFSSLSLSPLSPPPPSSNFFFLKKKQTKSLDSESKLDKLDKLEVEMGGEKYEVDCSSISNFLFNPLNTRSYNLEKIGKRRIGGEKREEGEEEEREWREKNKCSYWEGEEKVPSLLRDLVEGSLKGGKGEQVCLSSFALLLIYLEKLCLSTLLFPFSSFLPLPSSSSNSTKPKHMVLDFAALSQLEIVDLVEENSSKLRNRGKREGGGVGGSLLELLDHCSTPFGKRLMRKWVCHPLLQVEEIESRLDSVQDFLNHPLLSKQLSSQLSHLKDLQRLFLKIHTSSTFSTFSKPPPLSLSSFLSLIHSLHALLSSLWPQL